MEVTQLHIQLKETKSKPHTPQQKIEAIHTINLQVQQRLK